MKGSRRLRSLTAVLATGVVAGAAGSPASAAFQVSPTGGRSAPAVGSGAAFLGLHSGSGDGVERVDLATGMRARVELGLLPGELLGRLAVGGGRVAVSLVDPERPRRTSRVIALPTGGGPPQVLARGSMRESRRGLCGRAVEVGDVDAAGRVLVERTEVPCAHRQRARLDFSLVAPGGPNRLLLRSRVRLPGSGRNVPETPQARLVADRLLRWRQRRLVVTDLATGRSFSRHLLGRHAVYAAVDLTLRGDALVSEFREGHRSFASRVFTVGPEGTRPVAGSRGALLLGRACGNATLVVREADEGGTVALTPVGGNARFLGALAATQEDVEVACDAQSAVTITVSPRTGQSFLSLFVLSG